MENQSDLIKEDKKEAVNEAVTSNDSGEPEIKEEGNNETNEKKPFDAEIERITSLAYEMKKQGDEALTLKNYDEAAKNYTKAVITVKELFKQNKQSQEELTKISKEVLVTSNSNLCVIDIKKKDWVNCLRHANKVLHYDESNVKGRYRRCLAYINLGKFEKADEDLYELEDMIGGTKELEELEKIFETQKQKQEDEDGMIFKKMSKKLRDPTLQPKIVPAKDNKKATGSRGFIGLIKAIYVDCIECCFSLCRKKSKTKELTKNE